MNKARTISIIFVPACDKMPQPKLIFLTKALANFFKPEIDGTPSGVNNCTSKTMSQFTCKGLGLRLKFFLQKKHFHVLRVVCLHTNILLIGEIFKELLHQRGSFDEDTGHHLSHWQRSKHFALKPIIQILCCGSIKVTFKKKEPLWTRRVLRGNLLAVSRAKWSGL